jgi:hypothetical protein
MKITPILNVLLSSSASEVSTIEGRDFLEHDKNNCFYQFYQYHNNGEVSGLFSLEVSFSLASMRLQ